MTLVIFPRFTVILSTTAVVTCLNLQPLALMYKLLLSNAHSLLCRLESHLTIFYASLQAFLDRHLDRLITDLEETARNRNPAAPVTPEPWKQIPQKTLISCPSPNIPPSQYYPTQGGDLEAQPTLHRQIRRNPLAAVPEFDKEGWLFVCDPDLELQVPNQVAAPELLQNSMLSPPLDGIHTKAGVKQAYGREKRF